MISSPGCVCLTNGASGPMSTRDWTTSRPGTLRSCCWRSVRHSPGACCTLPLAPLLRSSVVLIVASLVCVKADADDFHRCIAPGEHPGPGPWSAPGADQGPAPNGAAATAQADVKAGRSGRGAQATCCLAA